MGHFLFIIYYLDRMRFEQEKWPKACFIQRETLQRKKSKISNQSCGIENNSSSIDVKTIQKVSRKWSQISRAAIMFSKIFPEDEFTEEYDAEVFVPYENILYSPIYKSASTVWYQNFMILWIVRNVRQQFLLSGFNDHFMKNLTGEALSIR